MSDEEKISELKEKLKNKRLNEEDEDYKDDEITADEIAEDIKELKTKEEIHDYLEEVHDVDIAEYLEDIIDENEEILRVLSAVDNEEKAAIIEEADEELQVKILDLISEEEALEIFSYMSPDDIVDILGNLDFPKRKSLLSKMKRSDANKLRELLGYAPETAGGIMTTQYIAFKGDIKLKAILEKIKLMAPKTEYIETIFVQNEKGEVIGEADLRDILIMPEDTVLYDITDENIKYVYPEDDQEEVAQLVSKYGLKVVPVLSRKKVLLGIITIDDVVDVIQEENTEDILKLAGTSDDEDLETSLFDSIKKRLPWLMINLFTAFLASFTVGLFSSTINKVVALAAAMPIVSGMGGNAGTQSLAVTIRSIALGEYENNENLSISIKYVLVGLINGLILGIVCGFIVYFMFGLKYLSLVILLSMIGNCIIACLVGYLIPVVLKILNIDPAMASAVLLTTVTDVCGFFLFLGLATMFLDKLI
ncbi:magnesium transporter [Oceanivirga miroungae]|uniref:Magnesium transporter MgtE n=1 Tax=Oceanivirga miroungae TaxID=1130046 RepID=A0A6I8MCT2_9FUSO|nr:magnesium transporter [Oceanivirga miroungae]VWL85292.1 magnesium transporter [Oceanivirga miroungae]